MSRRLLWTGDARRDLRGITVASRLRFGARQAAVTASRLRRLCGELVTVLHLGRERPELRPQLRSVALTPHIVFYLPVEQAIWIVRILHGSRDVLPALFDQAPAEP